MVSPTEGVVKIIVNGSVDLLHHRKVLDQVIVVDSVHPGVASSEKADSRTSISRMVRIVFATKVNLVHKDDDH